jgi:hypothetical protein
MNLVREVEVVIEEEEEEEEAKVHNLVVVVVHLNQYMFQSRVRQISSRMINSNTLVAVEVAKMTNMINTVRNITQNNNTMMRKFPSKINIISNHNMIPNIRSNKNTLTSSITSSSRCSNSQAIIKVSIRQKLNSNLTSKSKAIEELFTRVIKRNLSKFSLVLMYHLENLSQLQINKSNNNNINLNMNQSMINIRSQNMNQSKTSIISKSIRSLSMTSITIREVIQDKINIISQREVMHL